MSDSQSPLTDLYDQLGKDRKKLVKRNLCLLWLLFITVVIAIPSLLAWLIWLLLKANIWLAFLAIILIALCTWLSAFARNGIKQLRKVIL